MAQLDQTQIASASIATPATGVSSLYSDSADAKIKTKTPDGTISTLVNDGLHDRNIITNGGFGVQQRVATASTAIPGVSATTRLGFVADRWSMTVGNVTTPNWQQSDSIGATETGLLSRYYGRLIQNTNAAKFCLSQVIASQEMAHLRGQKVRLSCKIKQIAGSNAVYRLGLLQLTAAGSVETIPVTFISALNGASTEPTWGSNLAAITPDAVPAGENGTISGVALSITSTANWVRSSCVFTIPTDAKNLVVVLYRDTIGAAGDNCGIAEFQMTQNTDLVDYVAAPWDEEVFRCQRFFCKSFPLTIVPAASLSEATAGSGATGILGKTGSATALGTHITVQFPVQMYRTPSVVTFFTPTAVGALAFRLSGTTPAVQGTTATRASSTTDRGMVVTVTNEATTNGTVGDLVGVHYTADAEYQ